MVDTLNHELIGIRKPFGMFGQINWSVESVRGETIQVSIWTPRPLDGLGVATNVRNALLNYLQDLLPLRRCRVLFERRLDGVREEHLLDFEYRPGEERKSAAILIEANVAPRRERLRPLLRRLYRDGGHAEAPDRPPKGGA